MNLSAALIAELASLSEGLDRPRDEIQKQLHQLNAALVNAVPSLLGITVTVTLDGYNFTFTARHSPGTVRASLLVPLPAASGIDAPEQSDFTSALAMYAATRGALVDLAADLAHILRIDLATLVFDDRLRLPESVNTAGLQRFSIVNRALGVLMARGDTLESAQYRLQHLAGADGGNVAVIAGQLLAGLR